MRIVLVDDDKLSRTSLYNCLTQYMKHNVTEFESANDALNHLKL